MEMVQTSPFHVAVEEIREGVLAKVTEKKTSLLGQGLLTVTGFRIIL